MTDDAIIAIRKATRSQDVTTPFADTLAFARAIIAEVRPSGWSTQIDKPPPSFEDSLSWFQRYQPTNGR